MLRDLLSLDGIFQFTPAPLASAADIALAHDPAYVQAFVEGQLPPAVMRRIGFPWSQGLVERTLASAGGTLSATGDALEHGWGGTLAGGTHHALYAEGAGLCVFNDIAIAIRKLQQDRRIQRAAVIDLDVHQGDGTAAIFYDDPTVFTFSMHGAANFPFRKQQSRLDIGLPDGTEDEVYLARLAAALPEVMAFAPEIVFYQSGVDALATDRLGRLSLTPEGLQERDRMVLSAIRAAGVPFVVTLGGGYSEPIELAVQAHANTFRLMADADAIAPPGTPPNSRPSVPGTSSTQHHPVEPVSEHKPECLLARDRPFAIEHRAHPKRAIRGHPQAPRRS